MYSEDKIKLSTDPDLVAEGDRVRVRVDNPLKETEKVPFK